MRSALRASALAALCALSGATLAQDDVVNLRFVVWDGDQSQQALRKELERFHEAHPNIRVKFEAVTQNYQEKLLTQYAAGVAPDVAMMDPANFQRFARRGALMPLNPFFDTMPDFDIDSYYKPLVDAHSFEDTVYVLPRDIAPMGIIYINKEIFEEAGIPMPDGSWTWSWEPRPELREQCFTWVMQQLTEYAADGSVERYGFAPEWPGIWVDTMVYSQGARYIDDYDQPTELLYDDPRIRDAHRWYQDVIDDDAKSWIPSPTELSTALQSTSRLLFVRQEAAMYMNGIWATPEIRRDMPPGSDAFFDWDIVLAPAFEDGTRGTPTGGSGYSIMSTTEHPEEAWILAEWFAGKEGMLAMAEAGIAQPGIRDLAMASPWLPGPESPEDQLYPPSREILDEAVDYVVFAPRYEKWPDVSGVVNSEIDTIWSTGEDADTAIDEAMRRGQDRLDVIRREEALGPFNWTLAGIIGFAIAFSAVAWIYWPERKVKYTAAQKKESRVAYWFISPWIIGLVVFTLGPMILSVLMSFADWDIIMPARWRGGGNYAEMVTTDDRFGNALVVTFLYTMIAVPVGVFISLLLALLLNVKVKGMPLFRTFYYLPSLASAVAASLIWRRMFQQEGGLVNSLLYGPIGSTLRIPELLTALTGSEDMVNWLGNESTALSALIIMSFWGAGGGMVILLAGLQGIPQFYYEAATIDGASPFAKFRKITVPMLSPALLFVTITGFIGSFQVFTQALVMTNGGPGDATRFFMLHLYEQAFLSLRMGYASAMAWVLFVIILVFTLVQLRASKALVYYEGDSR